MLQSNLRRFKELGGHGLCLRELRKVLEKDRNVGVGLRLRGNI